MVITILLFSFMTIDYFMKLVGYNLTDINYYEDTKSSTSSFPVLAWMLLLFLSTYLINLGRNYLFPVLFIALGKQVKEYNKRKTISRILFGVVVLGIIINLISNFLISKSV